MPFNLRMRKLFAAGLRAGIKRRYHFPCITQSVGSGLRCNHSRLMHRGCFPARMLCADGSRARLLD
jgi:hypothetical protein